LMALALPDSLAVCGVFISAATPPISPA
jgi:hypothetical protein